MPRLARVAIPNCPHHVTPRGNRREDVFFCEADRQRYLALPATDWAGAELARIERIRSHAHTGRPTGDETFVDRLESLLGRVLRPKKAGRPRKKR